MISEECFAKAQEMDALAVKYPQLSVEYLKLARTWRMSGCELALDEKTDSYFPPASRCPLDKLSKKAGKRLNPRCAILPLPQPIRAYTSPFCVAGK